MLRRIIIVFCTLLLPILAHSQDQKTQRLFLKDGRALSGTVTIVENGIYQIETVDGDVLFFEPDEVDGVIGLPKEKNPFKKGVKPGDVVFRKGNQLYSVKSNQPLTQHDFNTMAGWNQYAKIRKKGQAGRTCMYIGAGSFALGGGLVGLGFLIENAEEYIPGVGLIIAGAGLVTGITGLIITSSSNSKLNLMANTYNQNPGYVLDFGVQQHGVGFALNF